MARFVHVFSTGRCGTQFLARALHAAAGTAATVRHEPGGAKYRSRWVFRKEDAVYEVLGRDVDLQRLFIGIENHIRGNKDFVSCGWPAFAWLPYFLERYEGAFAFVHLVRNPFDSAASHCTHDRMLPSGLPLLDDNKIAMRDPGVAYRELAVEVRNASAYERQLFHWLEVNRFLLEFRERAESLGVFRFETLFGDHNEPLDRLCTQILSQEVTVADRTPFDRVHRGLIAPPTKVRPALLDAVQELGRDLGYSEAELSQEGRIEALQERYGGKRYSLPFDPGIQVIEPR